jgi:hypothetical protein
MAKRVLMVITTETTGDLHSAARSAASSRPDRVTSSAPGTSASRCPRRWSCCLSLQTTRPTGAASR